MDFSGFNKQRYALHSKDYEKITSCANKISRKRIFVIALMSCGPLLRNFWVFSESFLVPEHTNEQQFSKS